MFQILIVEDDTNTRRLMKAILTHSGYQVHEAADGAQALSLLEHEYIDLIILDVMMPVMDGYEVARKLRAAGDTTPILMVTAKGQPSEKHEGFIAGTDDYMVKPVDEEEMLLRIKALLRRSRISTEHKLKVGDVTLDYDSLTVTRDGESQTLPAKEFQLLYLLLSYPNRIFTRMQLMDEIWGVDSQSGDATITVHVTRLRRRFEMWTDFKIVAVRGIGYKAVVTHE